VLNVKSQEEVKAAFNQIKSSLAENRTRKRNAGRHRAAPGYGEGAEVIIGVSTDRMLGHVMMFGLGGIYAELIKDYRHPAAPAETDYQSRRTD